jgi:hypothetical protein
MEKHMQFLLLLCFLFGLTAHADTTQAIQNNYARTYSTAVSAVSPGATPTDICVIFGNATTAVYVTHVSLSSTQTTAGVNTWFLTKRSTLDTLGTAVPMTLVKHDTNEAAPAATVQYYTAAPTTGVKTGDVKATHLLSPAPAGTYQTPQDWEFDQQDTSTAITLHQNEVLAINFGGAALPTGLSVNCGFTWNEK